VIGVATLVDIEAAVFNRYIQIDGHGLLL